VVMAVSIRVSGVNSALQNAAAEVEKQETLMNEIASDIARLNEVWQDEASLAYADKFAETRQSIDTFNVQLKEYVRMMQGLTTELESLDNDLRRSIQSCC